RNRVKDQPDGDEDRRDREYVAARARSAGITKGHERELGLEQNLRHYFQIRCEALPAIELPSGGVLDEHVDPELPSARLPRMAFRLAHERAAQAPPAKSIEHDKLGYNSIVTGRLVERLERNASENLRESSDSAIH